MFYTAKVKRKFLTQRRRGAEYAERNINMKKIPVIVWLPLVFVAGGLIGYYGPAEELRARDAREQEEKNLGTDPVRPLILLAIAGSPKGLALVHKILVHPKELRGIDNDAK